jgi:hypothetical protein
MDILLYSSDSLDIVTHEEDAMSSLCEMCESINPKVIRECRNIEYWELSDIQNPKK